MERFILVVVLCFAWTHRAFSDDHDKWNYELGGKYGPSNWGGICETGKSQTPIDIISNDTFWNKDLGSFTLTNYDKTPDVNFTAQNNGHSLVMGFPGNLYNVSGGGLTGVFTTVQFHLHWGSANTNGSEHFLDGKQYSAELHFVSYNTKYENLTVAAAKKDGLAVLGVFITVEGENNTAYEFLKYAQDVIDKNTTKEGLAPFQFKPVLPNNLEKFYRYSGSLTTPGCFESVTWTVFKDPVTISQDQMDFLRMLKDSDNKQMVDNFRPLLPVNNRTVYSSFEIPGQKVMKPTTTEPPPSEGPSEGPTADATAVSMTAAPFLLMLVAALFKH